VGFWQTAAVVVITALLAWIGHGMVSSLQRGAEKDRALEAEKREAYKRLLQVLYEVLASVKRGDTEERRADFESRFFELVRDTTVYAFDNVLRLFIRMKNQQEGADPKQVLLIFADLIIAVRRDLGHDRTTVTRREILSTFVTDIDELGLD
jgi:hypothetical protein